MDYRLHKENPFLNQHVLTCGRHELVRQGEDRPDPIWRGRKVISISDTALEELEMVYAISLSERDMLTLAFADDHVAFTEDQAQQIVDFVREHHHHNFLVHCFIGASRSVAVAKWLVEYLNINDPELADITSYNHHVYNTLKRVSTP